MARLQILELPTVERSDGTEETPFVLVVDQYEYRRYVLGADQEAPVSEWEGVAEKIGARQVLVFNETIEIPANEVPLDPDGYPLKVRIEGDFEQFHKQVQEETLYAQGKVTRALQATDQDRKASITDALGVDRLRDWDDICNAARGLRKDRDAKGAGIERVRNLHRPVEHGGITICAECSGWDGSTTDNSPCGYEHCPTLKALAADQSATDA